MNAHMTMEYVLSQKRHFVHARIVFVSFSVANDLMSLGRHCRALCGPYFESFR